MAVQRRRHRRHTDTPATNAAGDAPPEAPGTASGNTEAHPVDGPQFAQPVAEPVDSTYRVPHPSDNKAYKVLDAEQRAGELQPTGFPAPRGGTEPVLTLQQILGPFAQARLDAIAHAKQLVFHAVGDTGNVRSVTEQENVTNKMIADFSDAPAEVPSFFLHLGDVIYNFGEVQYYYDQYYDPYRNYPAPIIAVAGNHDGIVSPLTHTEPLLGFLRNFCAEGFEVMPEAGGLDRTAQIQPGVFYTFEAPLLRVLVLYSNTLEDPGVISAQGSAFPQVGNSQLDYLHAALQRVKQEKFAGALIVAHHHPVYTGGGDHGDSPQVLAEIDAICKQEGVWPHAVFSAHAHNYQRFTRTTGGMQIPYIIAGNGGHGIQPLGSRRGTPIRTPLTLRKPSGPVVLESYDDTGYGYLRVIVTPTQLRIEYHPASDGTLAKTPDDSVTVDLASRKIVHFTG